MEYGFAISGGHKPTVMVTNDHGIDGAGLRALVRVLVSTNLFHVFVCAPDSMDGKSNLDDFTLAAEACMPIITDILAEIKNKTYRHNYFLTIDVPTDVKNHKGYRLTKQSKSIVKLGWKQVTSQADGGRMLSTMAMNSSKSTEARIKEIETSTQNNHLLFDREFKQGRSNTSTPDSSEFKIDDVEFYKRWLPGVTNRV